jgi:RimJ/RimL family protein N-acetyltransferase
MSLLQQEIVLRGTEVELRPLLGTDASHLGAAAEGLRARHPVSFVPKGPDEARDYVNDALRARVEGRRYPFAIVWNGKIAGTTSYLDFVFWDRADAAPDAPAAVEIGSTWLSEKAQRTRCNTEAKLLLLSYAFEHWRVVRVSFKTDKRNARSRNAIERLGAHFEGVRRAEMLGADGAVRNSAFYSIVAAEWPDAKFRLQAMLA